MTPEEARDAQHEYGRDVVIIATLMFAGTLGAAPVGTAHAPRGAALSVADAVPATPMPAARTPPSENGAAQSKSSAGHRALAATAMGTAAR